MVSLVSCDKYDEVHKGYVESMDEIKYSVKPINVILHTGLERLVVSSDIVYTSSLDQFIIEVNDTIFKFEIPIPTIDDTARVMYELPNLTEGVSDVYLYTTDNEANKSLIKLYTGRVLGDRYRSEILNRNLLEAKSVEEGFKFKFNSPPEKSVRVDLTYMNKDDENVVVRIPSTTMDTIVTNFKFESEYSYVTYYLANKNAIDTVATKIVIKGMFPEDESLITE